MTIANYISAVTSQDGSIKASLATGTPQTGGGVPIVTALIPALNHHDLLARDSEPGVKPPLRGLGAIAGGGQRPDESDVFGAETLCGYCG